MDPHFLHGARVLEPVLAPPVEHPAAIAWRPGSERLLVAARSGAVFEVEPAGGTRRVVELGAEPAVLVCVDDDLVVLTVNVKEGPQRVQRFMQSMDLTLPTLFDQIGRAHV